MARYIKKFIQHPDERKRYTVDYSKWLDTGETISSVILEVTPTTVPALVLDGKVIAVDGKSVSFFVSAGDDTETYDVLVTGTTSAGQVKTLCILFAIRDC